MHKVTIGIPVYNAEEQIFDTLKSALDQTFENIEYLVVNDSSTDKTLDIIQKLKYEHPRGKDIRIINYTINQGVSTARNTIIRECKSKYLFFLDSDDFITKECIKKLYETAEKENVEVTYGSYTEKTIIGEEKENHFILPDLVLKGKDEFGAYANQNLHRTLPTFVWNILYNVSFLQKNNLNFHHRRIWEDVIFYYDSFSLIKSAALISDITYIYIKREGSLSQYQKHTIIPLNQIINHFNTRIYCKKKASELINKPYSSSLIIKTMLFCLDATAIAINKKKEISPPLGSKEIKQILKYPIKFKKILKFKKYKSIHYMLFLLGEMPIQIQIIILNYYYKFLKLYRRTNS